MTESPEAVLAGRKRPFTGSEFIESLRDGREVYIYGERVGDVTKHPAFRNAAVSVARLYDALHDAKTKDVLTAPTDTGSGGYTHKFFKAAGSAAVPTTRRRSSTRWAQMRSSMASLPTTLAPGIARARKPFSILIMRWSI